MNKNIVLSKGMSTPIIKKGEVYTFSRPEGALAHTFTFAGVPVYLVNDSPIIRLEGVPFEGHQVSINVNHQGGAKIQIMNIQTDSGCEILVRHPHLTSKEVSLGVYQLILVDAVKFTIEWNYWDHRESKWKTVIISVTPNPDSSEIETVFDVCTAES